MAPSTSNSDGDENRGDLAIRSIEFHRKSHRLISLLLRNSPLLTLPSSPNNHFSGSMMQPIIDFNAQAFVCEAQVITWMRTRFNQISGLCVPPWCSSLCMVLPALRQMSLFNTYTGIPICMSCCSWYSEYLVPGTLCLPGTLVPALSLSTPSKQLRLSTEVHGLLYYGVRMSSIFSNTQRVANKNAEERLPVGTGVQPSAPVHISVEGEHLVPTYRL